MVLRGFFGFLGVGGMFGSTQFMPISISSCILFSVPVWTAIFAFFALKEKLKIYDYISIVLAFLGVLLINRPWDTNVFAAGSQYT